jgi:hypothetical protein
LKRASKREKLAAALHNLDCTTQKKLASNRKFSISLTLSLLALATGRLELLKSGDFTNNRGAGVIAMFRQLLRGSFVGRSGVSQNGE